MFVEDLLYDPRDLWLESRKKTASILGDPTSIGFKDLFRQVIVSFAGKPVKRVFMFNPQAVPQDTGIIIDLNKYRPGADLEKLYSEVGLKHVILRMGGPLQFVYDNWKLTEDQTYRDYYDRAKALGMTVGAYVVYSAGIDARDYANSEILLDFIDRCMDGDRFKPDYMIVDDEVNKWWEGGREVYATAVNQVKGIKYLMPKIWNRFKLVPMHYSARWFMSQTAEYHNQYMYWFDSVNSTPNGKTVMNWYAWYLSAIQNSNKMYNSTDELKTDIPVYSSTSIDNYLQIGSFALYDLHQLSSNWITPFVLNNSGNPIGVDVSVTRKSAKLFFDDLLIDISDKDTTPPSVPQNLSAINITSNNVTLTWLPSSDNVKVTGYSVFQNGNQIAVSPVTQYTVAAQPDTTYSFTVDAFDAEGNHSSQSTPISVTTPPQSAGGCGKKLTGLLTTRGH